jgi:hypothetical protein
LTAPTLTADEMQPGAWIPSTPSLPAAAATATPAARRLSIAAFSAGLSASHAAGSA